jgi:hypothetical protein
MYLSTIDVPKTIASPIGDVHSDLHRPACIATKTNNSVTSKPNDMRFTLSGSLLKAIYYFDIYGGRQ